jgi:hypothetical protein
LLIDTLTPSSLIEEPPAESSIPPGPSTSLTGIETAGGLTSIVTPPAPGASLSVILIALVAIILICSSPGAGDSPACHWQPAITG